MTSMKPFSFMVVLLGALLTLHSGGADALKVEAIKEKTNRIMAKAHTIMTKVKDHERQQSALKDNAMAQASSVEQPTAGAALLQQKTEKERPSEWFWGKMCYGNGDQRGIMNSHFGVAGNAMCMESGINKNDGKMINCPVSSQELRDPWSCWAFGVGWPTSWNGPAANSLDYIDTNKYQTWAKSNQFNMVYGWPRGCVQKFNGDKKADTFWVDQSGCGDPVKGGDCEATVNKVCVTLPQAMDIRWNEVECPTGWTPRRDWSCVAWASLNKYQGVNEWGFTASNRRSTAMPNGCYVKKDGDNPYKVYLNTNTYKIHKSSLKKDADMGVSCVRYFIRMQGWAKCENKESNGWKPLYDKDRCEELSQMSAAPWGGTVNAEREPAGCIEEKSGLKRHFYNYYDSIYQISSADYSAKYYMMCDEWDGTAATHVEATDPPTPPPSNPPTPKPTIGTDHGDYIMLNSGTCAGGGYYSISDPGQCEAAAKNFALKVAGHHTGCTAASSADYCTKRPTGCIYSGKPNNFLQSNGKDSGVACGAKHQLVSYACLCSKTVPPPPTPAPTKAPTTPRPTAAGATPAPTTPSPTTPSPTTPSPTTPVPTTPQPTAAGPTTTSTTTTNMNLDMTPYGCYDTFMNFLNPMCLVNGPCVGSPGWTGRYASEEWKVRGSAESFMTYLFECLLEPLKQTFNAMMTK